VLALAQAGPAKIETQHRKSKTVQRLHRMEHNLVMQSPSEQRMRMRHQRGMRRVGRSDIEQRLQPSRRTVNK